MLPTRSTLEGWDPASLGPAGMGVTDGGALVYDQIRALDDDCDRLPEARGWSGTAHDAANAMFGRATTRGSGFKNYAEAVGTELSRASGTIGAARTGLLNRAEDVERSGELVVADSWVVSVKPAQVSEERAEELIARAKAEQIEINRLLTNVGFADGGAAQNLIRVASEHGLAMPGPDDIAGTYPGSPFVPPGDEVPNPMSLEGLAIQGVLRDGDLAQTVRESEEWTTADGQTRRTIHMMDGSRHEVWEWGDDYPNVSDVYYDKNGNEVSSTWSQDLTNYDGTQRTVIAFPDGSEIDMTRHADGSRTDTVTNPAGQKGVLPEKFFTHPYLTTAGGVLTGLHVQAGRGIPMLTQEALDHVGAGGKYGGPVLGVATAIYDTVTAGTFEDACVAAIAGTSGVVGGYMMGSVAAAMVTASANPQFAPLAAMVGDMGGVWTFGYVGGIIGNVVCR